jgi:hypothetical protein
MGLNHQVDVYCERTDFTFWSEPINAVTNAAFIIAGYLAFRLYRQSNKQDWFAMVMIGSLFAIGIGSFLFHTFATRWAGVADVASIALVIFTYHVATMYKIAGWNIWISYLSLAMIPALGWVAYQLPLDFMGSTKAYTPILPLLAIYFYYHVKRGSVELFLLPMAFFVFTVSMTVRVLDYPLCDLFPIGTHFLWHIFNGLTLYLAFRAYVKNN